MRINFSVDWLAFTSPLVLLPSPQLYVIHDTGTNTFRSETARNGYKTAWRNCDGAICQWNTERPEMRVLTQYSGRTLERYKDRGLDACILLQLHGIRDDSRLTRIDLAFDLHDTGKSIPDWYDQLKHGNIKCTTSKSNLIVGVDGGETLYIGSRQSDKFLRIYNKAAEQAVPGDWIRVELEIKGDMARELGPKLTNASPLHMAAVAKAILWSMVQFDDDIWKHLCSDGCMPDIVISHKKSDNIKGWLADQVAPALGKYIAEGGDRDILDQLAVLINAYLDRKSRL